MIDSGIYTFLNLANDKFYIGSACSFYKRYHVHKSLLVNNKHDNTYLQRAWNKYGQSNFMFVILEYIEDTTKLEQVEQLWLDKTQCYDRNIGYNSRRIATSNSGVIVSQETKDKIRASKLGTFASDETKRKLSLARQGRIVSAETKAKLSLAKLNQSVETRRKNSEAQKKRITSDETRAKQRAAWIARRSRDFPHLEP